ncbi:transcriptional repressor LexA [Patescibacteria group bacterium]
MVNLTKKQKEIFDFISDFQCDNGFSPSYREIAKRFDLSSTATVFQHVKNLESRGYVTISENEARSIELHPNNPQYLDSSVNVDQVPDIASDMIPLAGLITAGEPIEAVEEKELVSVPSYCTGPKGEYFALRVKGDSMIEDGIFDGDYVVIKKQDTAQDGDIVVALLENQYATLKRYYRESDHVRLQPANSAMEPFRIKENLQIQGKLTGLIRKYA